MNIRGCATGIGSLPYADPQIAVDRVLGNIAHIPFWPQLPKRSPAEGMVAQFIEGLPCLSMQGSDVVYADDDRDTLLEDFYARVISQDTSSFAMSEACAQGLYAFHRRLEGNSSYLQDVLFIKGHITGPWTFAASVKDSRGVAIMHDEIMMQSIVAGLTMKALWQIKLLEQFGKKIIIFIDEPFLSAFGSAYTPLNREKIVSTLKEITAPLRDAGALCGIHCCGNTDWSMFTDVGTIDIINFDAFGFLDKLILYSSSLQSFLLRGGILCWGIVPTQQISADCSPVDLLSRIEQAIEQLARKGVSERNLREQLIVSPSCGLGSLSEADAEFVLRLLKSLSNTIRP
jgi:methionine synthase II (cobalamin-independent)